MFNKTLELWDKPKMLWTMQDKFDFLCETWWVWLIIFVLLIIIVIGIELIVSYLVDKNILK